MSQNHILFVDDDVLNQWLVTDSLSTLGFTVTGLCRGDAAVEMLENGHEFDLLLTDLYMPDGMTGFELAEHWRRSLPGRPILYTSNDLPIAFGMLASDEGFIRKHSDTPDLLAVINELMTISLGYVASSAIRRTYYIH
jgi:CheY-like chemotaxis protein